MVSLFVALQMFHGGFYGLFDQDYIKGSFFCPAHFPFDRF